MDDSTPIVAIVGGSGFIGRSLVAQLRNRCSLRVIDLVPPGTSAPALYVKGDICSQSQLVSALHGITEIIHLAAVHRDDVRPASQYFEVNVDGTRNLCAAATQLGISRITFVSSVAVYGFQAGTPDETALPRPFNLYGQSKWQAEAVLQEWQAADPARVLTIVRPPAVFGPGNRGNVYNLISHLARGRFVMVGDGSNRKSMAFVENLAAFLVHLTLLRQPPGSRLYNYCDKPDLSMNELLGILRLALGKKGSYRLRLPYWLGLSAGFTFDLLSKLTGRNLAISAVRIRKFCTTTIFACERMHETGFRAPFAIEEALATTIATEFAGPVTSRMEPHAVAPTHPD